MLAQKRLVTVTLDIMCYDDLDLDHINWREILDLEPGEDVHCRIQEHDIDWQCASSHIGTLFFILNKGFLIENEYFMVG